MAAALSGPVIFRFSVTGYKLHQTKIMYGSPDAPYSFVGREEANGGTEDEAVSLLGCAVAMLDESHGLAYNRSFCGCLFLIVSSCLSIDATPRI